jgi:radical SAM superfamily enzyme YgiQ (UPF0313 family)
MEKNNQKQITFVHCVDLSIAQEQMFGVHYMPVWIYTLSSHIKHQFNNEFKINMVDLRIDSEDKIDHSDIFLLSGINQDWQSIKAFHLKLKRRYPNAIYLLGGPICWSYNTAGQINELFQFDHLFISDGEQSLIHFLKNYQRNNELPKIIPAPNKFSLHSSIKMDESLIKESIHHYYGGVIEVSRGCPFLCEFCDIRIQPDNNQAHNKPIEIIIQELDMFARLGVTQVLFACDNFIGSPAWAEQLCDAIIKWKEKTNSSVNLYTWLTINLYSHHRLLEKLKIAGFDMFFIGIESFGKNQLLETAKVQNSNVDLQEAIKTIQAYGFIIVAGIIFGFDTDEENVSQITLEGIKNSGLISGDPSLLTALPGTPLYFRMQKSERLRDGKLGLGGHKYHTNIKYLLSEKQIIDNFKNFVREFNTGSFQYQRLVNFFKNIDSKKANQENTSNYINISGLFKLITGNPKTYLSLLTRFIKLFASIERTSYVFKALFLILKTKKNFKKAFSIFNFWVFNWSNSIVKYADLKDEDFDIESVPRDFDYNKLIPKVYENDFFEPIQKNKIMAQRKSTIKSLKKIVNSD